jgi:hypothetical protein
MVMACSRAGHGPGLCPQYRVANSITVDGSAFFATHATAHELCVDGAQCMTRRPGAVQVGVVVDSGKASSLRVTVLTRTGSELLDQTVLVQLHRVAVDPGCGIAALRASVSVTARGALTTE